MTNNPLIPPKRVVEIVAFPDLQLLDVAGPLQVFASANEAAGKSGRPAPYTVRVVAAAARITTSAGLDLLAEPLPSADAPVDTLIIAGGESVHAACDDKELVHWLTARAAAARRVASVCTGAFLLGAAGLLAGKRAVTHWADCDRLARSFPDTRVDMNAIFVRDGRLWTSAGVTAGIDLALAMVEDDVGHAIAAAVARELVVFLKRPGGQAQFSAVLTFQERDREFDRLHGWMAGHLAEDLSVSALAGRMGMSERSLLRHYRASMGVTPARAVEKMRVEAACQLLATTRDPVKRVARRCGFGSEETMRRSFIRQIAVAPHDYRSRFSSSASL
ncbi:GlxA family transcriptional regulator [Taklimakanibacter deserti]|uniref:GlxA family transcriptional regulator n=1 Tax=Taklimakanibacter deserti TaxID=2267839 RepID=UPI000E64A96C